MVTRLVIVVLALVSIAEARSTRAEDAERLLEEHSYCVRENDDNHYQSMMLMELSWTLRQERYLMCYDFMSPPNPPLRR